MNFRKHLALLTTCAVLASTCAHSSTGLRALTRLAPKVVCAPIKQQIIRKQMVHNAFGISFVGAMVIAGMCATIATCGCLCQPESDEQVLADAQGAFQSAKNIILPIGWLSKSNLLIDHNNLTENQLIELAQQMNIINISASTHRNIIDNSIREINQLIKELKSRINQHQRNNPPNASMCATMQSTVDQLNTIYSLLQNRYQLIQTHEAFFELYLIEISISQHFNTLLLSPNIQESDLRVFANTQFDTKPFPYLSLTRLLKSDIAQCARVLALYSAGFYKQQNGKVTAIKSKLESLKMLAIASKDYQDATYAQQQYELKQQEIAQREEQIRLQKRQTWAQEEQARAAREQAAAATINAGANAVQAAAAIKSANAQTIAANAQALRLSLELDKQEQPILPPPYAP